MAITPTERLGNLGYLALALESSPGTAATPIDYTLLNNETLTTNPNFEKQIPIFGRKDETYQVVMGLRDHKGDIEVIAEPNTTNYFFDMTLSRGSSSGSGPYTWPYTLTGNSSSYTVDISTGNMVKRYCGVMASKLTPGWSKNQMTLKASVSAIYSFLGAVISSVTGSGPYTVNFSTIYTPNPTRGLVVGDLIRFYHPGGSAYTDATVASVVNGTSVTTSTNVSSFVSGDIMYLRPQAVNLNLLNPFLWANTNFQFAGTASAAASAAQLRVEPSSMWEISHDFESDSGSPRSGDFDPASLVRKLGRITLTVKKFYDLADDNIFYNQLSKRACIINHYAGSTNQYNLQLTMNHLVGDNPMPQIKSNEVNYSVLKYIAQYDTVDGQAFGVSVIDGLSSIS